jgi:hypothetical protein
MDALLIVAAALIGLLVSPIVLGIMARRRVAATPGVFRCRVRTRGCDRRTLSRLWSRPRTWAHWTHDVLLIHRGLWHPTVEVLPVRFPDGAMAHAAAYETAGLGVEPLLLVLRCDDETLVEVVASGADRTLLAGPFLAAAIPGLPKAPTERHLRDR